jgi:GntR family transcriptional regulator
MPTGRRLHSDRVFRMTTRDTRNHETRTSAATQTHDARNHETKHQERRHHESRPHESHSDVRLEVLHRQRVTAVRRVRDVLRSAILSGEYASGPLPSEHALTLQFGVSRAVVRDVLALLRDEGLIQRLQGAGTFAVTSARSARDIDVLNFPMGATEHARIFRDMTTCERLPAPAYVAARLGIGEGDPVVYHERLNLLDGRPVTLRAGWMTEAIGLRLTQLSEVHAPMLEIISTELGLDVGTVELKIEASIADSATAGALGVAAGTPMIMIERLLRASDGTPVELSFSRTRPDRVFLTTVLRRGLAEPVPDVPTPPAT